MRNHGESFDPRDFAEAFGETFDAAGFIAAFRSASDLGGAGQAAAAGFKHGADLLIDPIRRRMATSYGQLGVAAQRRGDYDKALDWYHRSLAIREQLRDHAGFASTASQIGILYTETGRAADAVPLSLRSLVMRVQSPEVKIDLYWLSRQRSALGAQAFRALVAEDLRGFALANLFEMLDDFEAAQSDGDAGDAQPPPPVAVAK